MFVLWGWIEWKSTIGRGEFHCPKCGRRRPYEHERSRTWFDVFFIPLLPLGPRKERVVCTACQATYPTDVLGYDSRDPRQAAAFRHALRRVAVQFMRSAGGDPAERAAFQEAWLGLTGQALGAEDLESEVARARADPRPLAEHLATIAGLLDDPAREGLVRAAVAVVRASGSLGDPERLRLEETAAALGMSGAHLRGVLAPAPEG